jgi:hypothetical protein
MTSANAAIAIFEKLPNMERGLFHWLMDLLVSVASQQAKNKMTSKNLGHKFHKMFNFP